MTRKLRPLAALALVALIVAGCGSSSPSESATAGSSAGAAAGSSGSAQRSSSGREKAVKFAQCMRDNGVSAFPDPDASGELTIDGVLNGSSLDPNSPAWKTAIAACKDLQPSGFMGDKEVTPEQQQARLAFAQCIRDNGVKDFPDPIKGEPLVDTRRIPSSSGSGGMSILNAAMQKCRALGAQAIGSQP